MFVYQREQKYFLGVYLLKFCDMHSGLDDVKFKKGYKVASSSFRYHIPLKMDDSSLFNESFF